MACPRAFEAEAKWSVTDNTKPMSRVIRIQYIKKWWLIRKIEVPFLAATAEKFIF